MLPAASHSFLDFGLTGENSESRRNRKRSVFFACCETLNLLLLASRSLLGASYLSSFVPALPGRTVSSSCGPLAVQMEMMEEREAGAEAEIGLSFMRIEELENHGISKVDILKLKTG